ncbi:hypothetical protein M758_3G103300 [Ceratodon purpureus]|uniref:Fatty acid hydroxylase domain-containing protein n=1 Tax=Ceratodon purpureus TaxID=3225 RepID=A0A8T0II64_CERPU|nr:hypothetical protein KC19_3G100300 [Ceratodon purpureus]KAG0622523.1 hypothetical protein M758_3G103300 [Ceratodon purpureus]
MATSGVVMRGAVCMVALVAVWGVVCMGADVEVVNGSSYATSGAVPGENVVPLVKGSPEYLQLFVEETRWYNDIVLGWWLPRSVRDAIPHTLQTWLRNYLAGLLLYFSSGGLWCLYIYSWKGEHFFPAGGIPAKEPIMLQIWVTMKAMPVYTGLPTLSEYMIEKGWTKSFARIEDVGLPTYVCLVLTYLFVVEFGIYWMHRELHDIKPLYKYLHATHHIYNKQNTLSPFAGLAFHPIDGCLQACPHVIALFLMPMHFFTHEILLFCEGVWTTNIHDCIDGNVWGIMGAGYHTIHHTTYRHNYGNYTVLFDWLFGTLRDPVERKLETHAKAS